MQRIAFFLLSTCALLHCAAAETPGAGSFEKHIQPLIAQKCLECHGPDKSKGGLRLNTREAALVKTKSDKFAIVPGNVSESELIARITSKDADERMPPKGDPLTPAQIEQFRKWISEGANWETHWAYRPVQRVDPPARAGASNPIDRFVLAKLDEKKVKPSPQAGRHTLIKRLYYDLLGLPPRVEDVDAFMNDKSPDAYQKLVDSLLQSRHFGERWGRHWLDKARYADSDGYEKDKARPDAWRYRDWVIDAVNSDMPFDEFTIEQLAGDLLPNAKPPQILATAFNRQTLTNEEGGVDKEQFRVEAVFDRVETVGTVWLGLTVGCARCHTHKYDQISQREYYQLYAFFNNADEANADVERNDDALANFVHEKSAYEKKLKTFREQLNSEKDRIAPSLMAWEKETQEKLKKNKDSRKFHALDIQSVTSTGGSTLTLQPDGSYLVEGENPDIDDYIIVARSEIDAITGFKIEVLADKSLPRKGPGRFNNGNFVLNEVNGFLTKDPEEDGRGIALQKAEADHSQTKFDVSNLVDGKNETAWAVLPQIGKDHWAVLQTRQPLNPADDEFIVIRLIHRYGTGHNVGRFKVTAMTGTAPASGIPDAILAVLNLDRDKRDGKQREQLLNYFTSVHPETEKLAKEVADLEKQAPKPPSKSVRVIAERKKDMRKTALFVRGDFLQPADPVAPGALSTLQPISGRKPEVVPDRLDLAKWLVDPANPLTSRVAINHVWNNLFGKGLVRTVNDFGVRGEKPSHPELLDWLAGEYVRRGWSLKSMIKLIVTSSTYQQASVHRTELNDIDPLNTLLYRQNRFRVEGEIVRDVTLAAGGLLNAKVGGPSVFPPMAPEIAAISYANSFKWMNSSGGDRYRRGMYTFFKRTAPHPNLTTFDCPDSNVTCVERRASNTPLQALTMLNEESFIEAAQAFAFRIYANGQNDTERINSAFRICLSRAPQGNETARVLSLLSASREWYKQHPEDAEKLAGKKIPEKLKPDEAAAWVAAGRVILNLDEFITRE